MQVTVDNNRNNNENSRHALSAAPYDESSDDVRTLVFYDPCAALTII